ncbi:hypothetical protein FB45DRAFT_951605 [Roridomyces roridus]|uniref:DUF6535 domain-containing protein n=1 Tax=Roridomyces roridus TaxID=1738132 RepID=A0AAD7F8Y4_9AGAR|nr:hypothetical protein FB45DRAFT_951605 [Roridomyces roridus]
MSETGCCCHRVTSVPGDASTADLLRECLNDLTKQMKQLNTAVKDLRSVPPVPDKKTMFWNSYKMVADEYDREHQVKYSTDLDTSLIFAGLFSAVSSAFIIAIQPELQGQTPLNHDTQTAILIAQCLLYVSLSVDAQASVSSVWRTLVWVSFIPLFHSLITVTDHYYKLQFSYMLPSVSYH